MMLQAHSARGKTPWFSIVNAHNRRMRRSRTHFRPSRVSIAIQFLDNNAEDERRNRALKGLPERVCHISHAGIITYRDAQ